MKKLLRKILGIKEDRLEQFERTIIGLPMPDIYKNFKVKIDSDLYPVTGITFYGDGVVILQAYKEHKYK